MKRKSFADMSCPIARTLEIVGEWWTLVIVRDAFLGSTRFDEFRRLGIADNILSARLDRLVSEGILERRLYQEHPPRHEYLLTDKGRDLLPVIAALGRWGMKWVSPAAVAPQFRHTRCGTEIGLDFYCPACDETAPAAEVEVRRRESPARPEPVPPLAATQG